MIINKCVSTNRETFDNDQVSSEKLYPRWTFYLLTLAYLNIERFRRIHFYLFLKYLALHTRFSG